MARTQKWLTDVEIFFLYLKTLKSWLLSDVSMSLSFELCTALPRCLELDNFFFLKWSAVLANHNSIFDMAFVIWAATGTLQLVPNVLLDQVLVT